MKLKVSNIELETRMVEVKAHNAQRTIRRYAKQGWQLKRHQEADGRAALLFQRQNVGGVEVEP